MPDTTAQVSHSLLATYHLPPLTFQPHAGLPDVLKPVWRALHAGDARKARLLARQARADVSETNVNLQAALFLGQAAAEWRTGGVRTAERLARRSLALVPRQWSSHQILLNTMTAQQGHAEAYQHLCEYDQLPSFLPAWDESCSSHERHLALAVWAWHMDNWDDAAAHLEQAFPDGVTTMPRPLQEDWFRLALHRDQPDDAAAAATALIGDSASATVDALLQTMVQKGWTKQALPLYEALLADTELTPRLRQRMIALYLREGAVKQAQELRQQVPVMPGGASPRHREHSAFRTFSWR